MRGVAQALAVGSGMLWCSACRHVQEEGVGGPAAPLAVEHAAGKETRPEEMNRETPYERVQAAAAQGRLTRKDALLLSARLMYAPETVPADSEFAPVPGAPAGYDMCGTGFYKEVHQVYDELTAEERQWLASLSEDLRVIITQKEREHAAP